MDKEKKIRRVANVESLEFGAPMPLTRRLVTRGSLNFKFINKTLLPSFKLRLAQTIQRNSTFMYLPFILYFHSFVFLLIPLM